MSNFLFRSAEVRWFLPGTEKWDDLLDWFTRHGQLPLIHDNSTIPQPEAAPFVRQEQPRSDDYLLLPDCATVGVKQRQGRLEVKALVAGPRPFAQAGVVGHTDQWVKWSLQPSAAIALELEADLCQAGSWRQVEKQRYTQKYAAGVGGVTAVSPDTWPAAGCNVEITRLSVAAHPPDWLTVGFEAFGPPNQIADLLAAAVIAFMAGYGLPPLPLAEENSCSYPAWLRLLSQVV